MDFRKALTAELSAHPLAEPQDIVKFCFQSTFGGAHILKNPDMARASLAAELATVDAKGSALTTPLGGDLFRVNLSAWRALELPGEWLFPAVTASAERTHAEDALFLERLATAGEVLRDVPHRVMPEAFATATKAYLAGGIRPISHSAGYREAYRPAYRILDGRSLRLVPILLAVKDRMATGRPTVVRIEGRAASGKSSMAKELQAILDCGTVHMDDFFLPRDMRTEERLATPGGNVHHERFAEEVLPHLTQDASFSYRRFDCSCGQLGDLRQVKGGRIYLVEGSYSAHPALGSYADITVFSDVAPKEQIERIRRRNGEEMAKIFQSRWIPMEEAYLTAFDIPGGADILL